MRNLCFTAGMELHGRVRHDNCPVSGMVVRSHCKFRDPLSQSTMRGSLLVAVLALCVLAAAKESAKRALHHFEKRGEEQSGDKFCMARCMSSLHNVQVWFLRLFVERFFCTPCRCLFVLSALFERVPPARCSGRDESCHLFTKPKLRHAPRRLCGVLFAPHCLFHLAWSTNVNTEPRCATSAARPAASRRSSTRVGSHPPSSPSSTNKRATSSPA
jgi:hypothetical protein